MSNVAYLLALEAARPVAAIDEHAVVLRTGSSMVPAFWLACFRPGDLRSVMVPVQASTGEPLSLALDMLLVPRTTAIANLHAFVAALRSCPDAFRDAEAPLATLAASLEQCAATSIQLHDVEIQMMVGPDENRPWIDSCLRYVEDVRRGALVGEAVKTAPAALELFDQAQIRVPEWVCELDWEESLIGIPG